MQEKSQFSARRASVGLGLAIALAFGLGAASTAHAAATPQVTLNPPPLRSNNAMPSFSGTASDTTPVAVFLYRGKTAEGEPFATLKAQGTGGSWASAHITPPLADGIYTAVAEQRSSSDESTGVSDAVSFEVSTQSPAVTLNTLPSPSNGTTPSFSGTASDATSVTVAIFEGTRPEGYIVATVTAQGTRASWSSGELATPLPGGRHTFTALATQTSELGNPPGRSAPVTFVVDTEPPTVTLSALPSPSNDTTPSFSGAAGEDTPVTVAVHEGASAAGRVVATASAIPSGGSWASSQVTPALASGTYTVVAIQPSGIGNAQGASSPVTFAVDTSAPAVTLNALPSPAANRAPSFSGTASDHTTVTVYVYAGNRPEGTVVATATATATATAEADGGEWISDRASPVLSWGEYTAVAAQPSSLGNPSGASSPVSFTVAPIPPAAATEGAFPARTSAALYASVDPEGGPVNACYFEVGTTVAYARSVECGFVSGASEFPPATTAAVAVFIRIYGLSPGTTYHYRIVAVGEGGTAYGADATFTTLAPRAEAPVGGQPLSPGASSTSASASAVAAGIARQLNPRGPAARIAALLRRGLFRAPFRAPAPGTAHIGWYYLPPGAKRSRRRPPAPLLVAYGQRSFASAGTATVEIRLTAAGRHLLARSRRLLLVASCVFVPVGAGSVRTSRAFELRR